MALGETQFKLHESHLHVNETETKQDHFNYLLLVVNLLDYIFLFHLVFLFPPS